MSSDLLHAFSSATLMTLSLAVAGLFIGLVLAIGFVLLESSRLQCVRKPSSVVIALLRGLPELIVVFILYYGLGQLFFMLTDEPIELSPFLCGAMALGIIFAAYASQTLRGAIQAIPKGQWEAGDALGFSRGQTFFHLILPQVWRHALPGLANQWLVLLKDTALVSLIGVDDLMRQAQLIDATTHTPFTWYSFVALIYLAITLISQMGIKQLEKRVTRFERGQA